MDLLDSSLDRYIISVKKGGDRSHILDFVGNEIGVVRQKKMSERTKISLETDRSVLCTIDMSLVGSRYFFVAKFPAGKILGRAKQSPVPFRNYVDWYSPEGDKVFSAQNKSAKWEFHIVDSKKEEKIYVEIKKSNKVRGPLFPEISKEDYEITILDKKASRMPLLVFAIIIVTGFHSHQTV
ncbi:MAG: hypothetical protein ACTSUO_02285 [Candidatus Thorarchaeota archaeon]